MKTHFDLIVIGGGFAGTAAAIAAARQGLSVLLAEREGALGGAAVNCLVNPFMPYYTHVEENGEKRRFFLSRGIFREIVKELVAIGGAKEGEIQFGEEYLKIVLDRLCAEAGVDVLFHVDLCGVEVADGRIQSVSLVGKSGVMRFTATNYIDATGDADFAVMAGCPTRLGRAKDSLCQPMTLCFRLVNVDLDGLWNGEIQRLQKLYKEKQAAGEIKNPRENILVFALPAKNTLHLNTTRVVKLNPVDPFDVSKAEAIARGQMLEMFQFLKANSPAFRDADLFNSGISIGVRESRMIEARHVLTQEELVAGKHFPDGIAAGNYDIDIHSPDGGGTSHYYFPPGVYYTIPYRCLLPREFDNLLVAGRSVGATHEAQASIRIMPICVCMGEAAGTAAAMAKETGVAAADVDTDALRAKLSANGAFVG
jgi:hypothetical protein